LSGNKFYLRFDMDAMTKVESMLAPFGRGDFFNLLDPTYNMRELMTMLYAGINGHYGQWDQGRRIDKYSFDQIRDTLDKHFAYLRTQALDKDGLSEALIGLKLAVAEAAREGVGFSLPKKGKATPGPSEKEE
jgi:hypothetical protein